MFVGLIQGFTADPIGARGQRHHCKAITGEIGGAPSVTGLPNKPSLQRFAIQHFNGAAR